MLNRVAIAVVMGACCSSVASATDWANQLFNDRDFDFGSVARAAKTEHVFEFTNPYDEPIHVRSVRASCGCTTPTILTETVAPGATGQIKAQFNTRSFLGQRGATVTVVFDRPRYGEAQLRVDGYVRRDVVCNPGELDFGSVRCGVAEEKRIEINYAGRDDWKIESVSSTIPGLDVSMEETARANGRVTYALTATLTTSESGFVNGEIELLTNDANYEKVPLSVTARVSSAVSVSPSPLVLGRIVSGENATKKAVLRGDTEFRILSATCGDPRVTVEVPSETKTLQMLPITFSAGEELGPIEFEVVIETDQSELGPIKLMGQAEVVDN
ncbi:MAG: DUF1573 domain-containing protein [Planctomycetales bacterium]|nr:DUF1573 domain-containing protein [Planctomycetales bacterium]